jgi:hypothetical protein
MGAIGSRDYREKWEGVGNMVSRKGGLAAAVAEADPGEEKGEGSWRLAHELEIWPSGGCAGSRAPMDVCMLYKITQRGQRRRRRFSVMASSLSVQETRPAS